MYWFTVDKITGQHRQRARDAAEKAFELVPGLPEAHQAMGDFYMYVTREHEKSLTELAIAARAMPGSSEVQQTIAEVQRRRGDFEAAIATTARANRYDPDSGENPRVDTYEVDMDSCGPMVLDALIKIKNEIDPTLTFRRSCREGICGSCAMNIDGSNTLACTRANERGASGDVKIYPSAAHAGRQGSRNGPDQLLRAVRLDQALAAGAHAAAPGFASGCKVEGGPGTHQRAVGVHPVCLLFDELSELLVEFSDRYLGPAALLAAYRWLVDTRDEATGERLDELEDPFRLYRCHTIMNCTQTCPKGPEPGTRRSPRPRRCSSRAQVIEQRNPASDGNAVAACASSIELLDPLTSIDCYPR